MSTVDKAFADNIAKHGGWHNGDSDNTMGDNPQVVSIVEYDNAFDGVSYGLVFAGREGSDGFGRYIASEFVRNPRIYWRAAKWTQFAILTPGTPEWHEHRTRFWNASDAPAMMGAEGAHETRSQLLHRIYCMRNGLPVPEHDEATLRLFAEGHRTERLARPIAESLLDDELAVLRVYDDRHAASLDGRTLAGVHWECKLLNNDIREALQGNGVVHQRGAILPAMYRAQIAHQHLCDPACPETLFTGALFDADGNLLDARHCRVERDEALIAQVRAGWVQFERDLKAYVPPERTPAAVAAPVEALPTVALRIDGTIAVQSNLDRFETGLRAFIERIPKTPTTDQEFADAGLAVKILDEAEKALAAAENAALAQLREVEAMRTRVRTLGDLMRSTRLTTTKLVERRKQQIRDDEVTRGHNAMAEHLGAIARRLGMRIPAGTLQRGQFAEAIKGRRTMDTLRDAIDTELAAAKIEADQVADRMARNLEAIKAADEFAHLFADRAALAMRDPEAVQLIIDQRVTAERQRLDKAAEDAAAAARAAVQQPVQVAEAVRPGIGAPPMGTPAPAAPATGAFPVVKLSDLCAMVGEGFSMSAEFARALGITVHQTSRTSPHRGALVVATTDVQALHAALVKRLGSWVS